MANIVLSKVDINIILESLKYSKLNIENYDKYPTYEYKQSRIEELNKVYEKINTMKKYIKE